MSDIVQDVNNQQQKTIKKNARIAKCRFLKNLLIWFAGFLLIPAILALAIFVLPVKTYLNLAGQNTEEAVSAEISDKSVFSVLTNLGKISGADVKVLGDAIDNALKGSAYKDIIQLNREKFDEFKFGDISSNGVASLTGCFNIDLTLEGAKDTLGLDLGAITAMESFNNFSPVPVAEMPDTTQPFNYADYYVNNGTEYARAFDDNGNYVNGAGAGVQLYYPALNKISIVEVANVFDNCIQRLPAKELLGAFDPNYDENSIIGKVLADKQVKELGSITVEDMLVKDLLTIDATTLQTLCDAVVVPAGEAQPTPDTIKVGQLESVQTDNIYINTVMPKEDNPSLAKILSEALNGTPYEEIKMTDLSRFSTNNIRLVSAMENNTNEDLWNIIVDATGKAKEVVTLGDLSAFNMDNIYLSSVIKEDSNPDLVNIITEATNKTTYAEVKVSDLSSFNVDNVKLGTVIDPDTVSNNNLLYELSSDSTVTLGNLPTKANAVEVSKIFDAEVFTTTENSKSAKYVKSTVGGVTKFTRDDGATGANVYYVSPTASVWLFVLYDCTDKNATDGYGAEYTDLQITYGELSDSLNNVGAKVSAGTIRELVAAGVLEDNANYSLIYNLSLVDALAPSV